MNVLGFTLAVPVSDLQRSVAFYQNVLELGAPELAPAPGIVEFDLGRCWLQLSQDEAGVPYGPHGAVFGVADARGLAERLRAEGVVVGPVGTFEDTVTFVEITDPDGNVFTLVTEYPTGEHPGITEESV